MTKFYSTDYRIKDRDAIPNRCQSVLDIVIVNEVKDFETSGYVLDGNDFGCCHSNPGIDLVLKVNLTLTRFTWKTNPPVQAMIITTFRIISGDVFDGASVLSP